jgi:hypothetical protein
MSHMVSHVVAVERRPGRGAERASRYVYCDGLKE